MELQFLWLAMSSRSETWWLAVNSRSEGRVIQCLAMNNGRGVDPSEWLAMSSRRGRGGLVLTQITSSSHKSTRRASALQQQKDFWEKASH